jgi:uncharacterized protein YcnI
LLPGVAAADVTVTPSTGAQGSALKLVFTVSENRPPAHTVKVELRLPQATPVAEVYPLSVPDWAPRIITRELDRPIRTLHGGGTTQVVSSITWIRVKPPSAGATSSSELPLSLGPLPTTDRLVFTVIQTYSDGTAVVWADAPAPGGASPGGASPGGASGNNPAPVVSLRTPEPGSEAFDDFGPVDEPVADAGSSPTDGGFSLLYSVLIAGLAAGALWAVWTLLNRRHPVAAADSPARADSPDEPNPAGDPPADTDVAEPPPAAAEPPPATADTSSTDAKGGPVAANDVRA